MLLLLQPLLLLVWSFVVSSVLWTISWFSDSRDEKETLFAVNESIIIHYSPVLFCYLYFVGSQEPLQTAPCPDLVLQLLVTRMTPGLTGRRNLYPWRAGVTLGRTGRRQKFTLLEQHWISFT